jgi:hypothetical protein
MAQAPDDAIDRLYGLALDAFIGERDAAARELRNTGKRGEAAAVKSLPKPTIAAWAVNQAVRSQPRAARELWEAGDALAGAQEAVLSGKGSGSDLRSATERERMAVEPLVDAARGLLTSSGGDLSEATIERVRATLHAAAIDPDAREEVAAGRATRERSPRGLFGGEPAPPATGKRPRGAAEGERGAGTRGAAAEPAAGGRRGAPASGGRRRGAAVEGEDAAERGAAARKREREEAAARKREEAAARKREREEAAARERARKAAADRVGKAQRELAQAEARSAAAAERLEEARARERAAVEALADARADLRALER